MFKLVYQDVVVGNRIETEQGEKGIISYKHPDFINIQLENGTEFSINKDGSSTYKRSILGYILNPKKRDDSIACLICGTSCTITGGKEVCTCGFCKGLEHSQKVKKTKEKAEKEAEKEAEKVLKEEADKDRKTLLNKKMPFNRLSPYLKIGDTIKTNASDNHTYPAIEDDEAVVESINIDRMIVRFTNPAFGGWSIYSNNKEAYGILVKLA